jgi:hypothetical protein
MARQMVDYTKGREDNGRIPDAHEAAALVFKGGAMQTTPRFVLEEAVTELENWQGSFDPFGGIYQIPRWLEHRLGFDDDERISMRTIALIMLFLVILRRRARVELRSGVVLKS